MKSEYINCKNCKDDCRCSGKNITPICISFKPVKTTNADRIRAMTDEELAEFIVKIKYPYRGDGKDYEIAFNWLKAPVEVDNGT